MRYLMKQKLVFFGDDFTIEDEDGRERYFVDGKAFAVGDKLSFQDMQKNELARIEQKLLSFGKTYRVFRNGQLAATIKKDLFTLFRASFSIETLGGGDLDAQGNFLQYEYEFANKGRTVATVSKKFFAFADTYGVEIVEGEDHVLILAAAVVIDLCCHGE